MRLLIFTFVILGFWLVVATLNSDWSDGDPTSGIFYGNRGAHYNPPAVATGDHNRVYWAYDVATDTDEPSASDTPAALNPQQLSADCILPRPSQDAEVVFVEIGRSRTRTPLYFFRSDEIQRVGRKIRAQGKLPPLDRLLKNNAAGQVNVFVTETERPVYLVLGASSETVWSLQLAQGVRIDGISIISRNSQAVAHVPTEVPVGFNIANSVAQKDCAVGPKRRVDKTWKLVQKLDQNRGTPMDQRMVDGAIEAHDQYRSWLVDKVGAPDRVISAATTSHILIGPKPVKPIDYRTLRNTDIIYPDSASAVWGGKASVEKTVYQWAEAARR